MLKPERLRIKTSIKLRLNNFLKKWTKVYYSPSYSQLGEDVQIKHILKNDLKIDKGTYVDVGCNHPIIFSNTFRLYLEGWHGVTIDFNEQHIQSHKIERPKDFQIRAAVSDVKHEVQLFEFENSLIRTIDKDFYESHKKHHKVVSTDNTITTRTLNEILIELNIESIDLLCIDVEGHDFQVLKSIDLKKYRPKLIVIEMHGFSFEKLQENDIYRYLKDHNYQFSGYLIANGYFVDSKSHA